MGFTPIDLETWDRREYFAHYLTDAPCTFSMTVKLDITRLRASGRKLYPAVLFALAEVVNRHAELRMRFDEAGRLGVFDRLYPCYTVFHEDTETFSNLWTEWDGDYSHFCAAYERDLAAYGVVHRYMAKPGCPPNTFPASMVPWERFDALSLNVQNGFRYLAPIFTMGRFYEENGRIWMPLAVQAHHAVCDGFHVCRAVRELRELLNEMP